MGLIRNRETFVITYKTISNWRGSDTVRDSDLPLDEIVSGFCFFMRRVNHWTSCGVRLKISYQEVKYENSLSEMIEDGEVAILVAVL